MDQIRLNLDKDGFSRRECPRCRAHFKVPWSGREERVVVAAMTARVRELDASDCDAAELLRTCPYCAAVAPAEHFLTSDALQRLDAHARSIEAEVRWRRMRAPLELLAAPRATYVAVPPAVERVPQPREDWDDLTRVLLPCCGEEQKVTDAWVGPIRCHLCGTAHLRAGPRDIGLELAVLKRWASDS